MKDPVFIVVILNGMKDPVFIVVILNGVKDPCIHCRHPERSEGSLYLWLFVFLLPGDIYNLPCKRPSSPKINPELVSHFLASKNERQSIHVCHALHHVFTTISPSRKRNFPKITLKNTSKTSKNSPTTSRNFSDRHAAKNPP
jgi:hypothetical protein